MIPFPTIKSSKQPNMSVSNTTEIKTENLFTNEEYDDNTFIDEYEEYLPIARGVGSVSRKGTKADSEIAFNQKMRRLEKNQERAAKESTNRGGKTKMRQQARKRFILEENTDSSASGAEEVPNSVKADRVILERFKRKPGHRGRGSTARF